MSVYRSGIREVIELGSDAAIQRLARPAPGMLRLPYTMAVKQPTPHPIE